MLCRKQGIVLKVWRLNPDGRVSRRSWSCGTTVAAPDAEIRAAGGGPRGDVHRGS